MEEVPIDKWPKIKSRNCYFIVRPKSRITCVAAANGGLLELLNPLHVLLEH